MANYECAICGAETRVSRTTVLGGTTARRERICAGPEQHTTFTVERPEEPELLVVRASGDVEPFDRRNKLEYSIRLAAVSTISRDPQITKIADAVLRRLDPQPRRPIPTVVIGDAVLTELKTAAPLAAIRYATTFLGKRGRIKNSEDLATWITTNVLPNGVPEARNPSRPVFVIKRRKATEPTGQGEDFSLIKLWWAVKRATRGLGLNGKDYDAAEYETALGSVAAYVLAQLHGQPIVTSGQISAEVLRVLRSVSPLAALRYSIPMKSYTTAEAFLDECVSLTQYPPAPIDLGPYAEAGAALAEEVRKWSAS
ncbi:hypothetical protein [Kribbella sp. CA-247076]|uniref:hypothetical protein n=1 Tax=Kribbella sp. CA-247076 TaxID=3239941 RepID=UPI003D91C0FE